MSNSAELDSETDPNLSQISNHPSKLESFLNDMIEEPSKILQDSPLNTLLTLKHNQEFSQKQSQLTLPRKPILNDELSFEYYSYFEEKVPIKHNPNLPQRFMDFQDSVRQKLEELTEEIQSEEMKECTFQPNPSSSAPRRSLSNFIQDEQEREQKRIEKLEKARNEIFLVSPKSSTTKRPRINEDSLFERLSTPAISEKAISPKASEKNFSFIPQINSRSKKLERSNSVGKLLYEDAINRMKKTHSTRESQISMKHITERSEKVLQKKFFREFNECFNNLDVEKKDLLPYSLYIILLARLRVIQNNMVSEWFQEERYLCFQAWEFLVPEGEYISRNLLYDFLLAVVNYPTIKISSKLASEIHSDYYLLYSNWKSKQQKPEKETHHSFCPKLSKRTIKLAKIKQAEREEAGCEFLATERKILKENLKKRKLEFKKEEQKAFTDRPRIIGYKPEKNKIQKKSSALLERNHSDRAISLFLLSKTLEAKNNQAHKEAEIGKFFEEANECTFTPKIMETYTKGKKSLKEIQGMTELIDRLKKAREEKDRVNSLKDRGYTSSIVEIPIPKLEIDVKSRYLQTFKTSSPKTTHKTLNKGIQKSLYINRELSKIKPLPEYEDYNLPSETDEENYFRIEISLPDGNHDYILLYSDTNKLEAVNEFIEKHSLQGETAEQLKKGILSVEIEEELLRSCSENNKIGSFISEVLCSFTSVLLKKIHLPLIQETETNPFWLVTTETNLKSLSLATSEPSSLKSISFPLSSYLKTKILGKSSIW